MSDASSSAPPAGLWDNAEIIHRYSRADAITDGALIPVDPKIAGEAGFKVPVAITRAAHTAYVALTPAAERAGNSVEGRLWDVLYMARRQLRAGESSNLFQLYVVTTTTRPKPITLRITIGPGDEGEPVLTILCPEES